VHLHLVRHGSAGVRNDVDPADCERHLDDHGHRQAALIAERLGDRPIGRVLASPAARCVETVAPLAAAAGVGLETEPRLFEGTDVDDAWGLVESLVAEGADAVLCSHGDVIPELIRRAKGRGMDVPGKSGCSKGSVWTLVWDGERFATGAYQPTSI